MYTVKALSSTLPAIVGVRYTVVAVLSVLDVYKKYIRYVPDYL